MCEFYTEKELKKMRFKAKVRETASNAVNTAKVIWSNNKKEIVAAAIACVPIVTWEIKTGRRDKQIKKEQHLKDCYIYDRSLGKYWELKRKLSTIESLEIERRRSSGEKLGAILKSMNLVK